VTDTPKTRTKNAALFAVESKDATGATVVLAYVRSTSTAEAKSALPITARRLGFDEASRVLRSGHAILGMAEPGADDKQMDIDDALPKSPPLGTQDVNHQGMIDKSDLPPAKTVNEALAVGAKVRDDR